MNAQETKNYIRTALTPVISKDKEILALDSIIDLVSQALTSGIPDWLNSLTFETDGSNDGSFCTHSDTDGKLRFWKTKTAGNINHEPPTNPAVTEDTYWIEVSPSTGSAIKEWSAGIYGDGLVIVYYQHSIDGRQLYILVEPVRPFESTNIETEITAGKWASYPDLYSKPQVDQKITDAITGLKWKDSVRAATTANITLSGAQTIDGISIIAGDRVLVKDQTTQTENGIYLCSSGSWPRTTDGDSSSDLTNAMVPVEEGTANADTTWRQTADGITLGSSNIVFANFTASIPDASESIKGIGEISTQAESDAGTNDTTFLTPLKAKTTNDAKYPSKQLSNIDDLSGNNFQILSGVTDNRFEAYFSANVQGSWNGAYTSSNILNTVPNNCSIIITVTFSGIQTSGTPGSSAFHYVVRRQFRRTGSTTTAVAAAAILSSANDTGDAFGTVPTLTTSGSNINFERALTTSKTFNVNLKIEVDIVK